MEEMLSAVCVNQRKDLDEPHMLPALQECAGLSCPSAADLSDGLLVCVAARTVVIRCARQLVFTAVSMDSRVKAEKKAIKLSKHSRNLGP